MRNVLITGGAGFIGANFVRYLLRHESQVQVVNLDALTYAGNRENIRDLPDPDRHIFIHGNICDRDLVEMIMRENEIDTIVNFAAESHVDRSIAGPSQFIETNILGTFNLLEVARQLWLDENSLSVTEYRFHHISTDEVFGSLKSDDPPFSETTAYKPNSPYAASKASADHLVRAYGKTYGLPVTVTNCSNNYGPYQYPEKLIPVVILNALNGKMIPIYGDGKQIRDWLYVEDHCEAIFLALLRGQEGDTYVIGGGNQLTNLEVVNKICYVLDDLRPKPKPYHSLIRFVEDRPGHDRRYDIDSRKIQRELNWKPSHTFEDGLQKTVEWYLKNADWVEHVLGKRDYKKWMRSNYTLRKEKFD